MNLINPNNTPEQLPSSVTGRPGTVGIALGMIEAAVRYTEVEEANTQVNVAWPDYRSSLGPVATVETVRDQQVPVVAVPEKPKDKSVSSFGQSSSNADQAPTLNIEEIRQTIEAQAEGYIDAIT